MSESFRDRLSRVGLMSEDSQTWDLSDNDMLALRSVLINRRAIIKALKALVARCDRELADPPDVPELELAKSIIAESDI